MDIYTSSWGPQDDGKRVEGPGHLAKEAIRRGITEVIFVHTIFLLKKLFVCFEVSYPILEFVSSLTLILKKYHASNFFFFSKIRRRTLERLCL